MLMFRTTVVFVVGDQASLARRIWRKLEGSGPRVATVEIPSVDTAGSIAEDDPAEFCCCQTNPGMIISAYLLHHDYYMHSAMIRCIQICGGKSIQ